MSLRVGRSTHIGVDAPDGDGEHAVEVGARPASKRDQVSEREDAGKETRLDGAADEPVHHSVRLAEAGL